MSMVFEFECLIIGSCAKYRRCIDEVLGDIEFNVFHRYFDMVNASGSVTALFLLKYSTASRTTNDYSA